MPELAIGKTAFFTVNLKTFNSVLWHLEVSNERDSKIGGGKQFQVYGDGISSLKQDEKGGKNLETEDVPEDIEKSIENVFSAINAFIKTSCFRAYNDFKSSNFKIVFSCSKENSNTNLYGESFGFALCVGIFSSFFEIPIKQNSAFTGWINKDDPKLMIGYVTYIKDKIHPYLKDGKNYDISTFMLPNLLKQSSESKSDEISKSYDDVLGLFSKIISNNKTVVFCDDVLSSLKFVTEKNDFVKAVNKLSSLGLKNLVRRLFNDVTSFSENNLIISNSIKLYEDIFVSKNFVIDFQYKHRNKHRNFLTKTLVCVVILLLFSTGLYWINQHHVTFRKLVKNENILPIGSMAQNSFLSSHYRFNIFYELGQMIIKCYYFFNDKNKLESGDTKYEKHDDFLPVPVRLYFGIAKEHEKLFCIEKILPFYERINWNSTISQGFNEQDRVEEKISISNFSLLYFDRKSEHIVTIAIFDIPEYICEFESFLLFNVHANQSLFQTENQINFNLNIPHKFDFYPPIMADTKNVIFGNCK